MQRAHTDTSPDPCDWPSGSPSTPSDALSPTPQTSSEDTPLPPKRVHVIWRRRDQWVLAVAAGLALIWLGWDWATTTRWGLDTTDVERDPGRLVSYRVDVNKANWVQWRNLAGVGEVLARRIVAYRKKHGPFHSVDDLQKVSGIGPKLTERLRPYLFVETVPAGLSRQP